MNPSITLALQIIQLIEALAPGAVSLFQQITSSAQTVDQYIADAKAKDAATAAAALAELGAEG
jgi:hypothetical protein